MSCVFITGSTDGLGRAAASALMGDGHDVVLHARTLERAAALSDLAPDAAGVVIGDLASAAETRDLAGQVNRIGRMDAVIHNAGVYLEPSRAATAEGHAKTLAVNTLAPYLLTALIDRPARLIYLSSGLHHAGAGSLRDIDWTVRPWNAAQAYAETKLQVTALALTLARAWPQVLGNAVDPGWVPTKMGGAAATDDLEMGHRTQTWLAVSNDAAATVSGGYWYHQQRYEPAPQARDLVFQDQLMDRLTALTGVALFWRQLLHHRARVPGSGVPFVRSPTAIWPAAILRRGIGQHHLALPPSGAPILQHRPAPCYPVAECVETTWRWVLPHRPGARTHDWRPQGGQTTIRSQPSSRGSVDSAKMFMLARRVTAWPRAGLRPPCARGESECVTGGSPF